MSSFQRDAETARFLEAAACGQFLLRSCLTCQEISEPATKSCPACSSAELAWVPARGGASVVSWSVLSPAEGAGDQPTVIAIGALDEGPWWWSTIVGADPNLVYEGMRLQVEMRVLGERSDGESLPVFRVSEVEHRSPAATDETAIL